MLAHIKLTIGMIILLMLPKVSVAAPAASAKMKLVSIAVAQVAHRVITSREVMISYFIDQWDLYSVKGTDGEKSFSQKKLSKERLGDLPQLGSDAFKKQLAIVQLEHLVMLEAENFSIGEVSTEEIKRRTQDFLDSVKDLSAWRSLEAQISEIETILSRKTRAKQFIKYKTESMGIQITEVEIKEYYDSQRVKFGQFTLDKMRDNIREFLSQQSIETKMKDWVGILRKKYSVRNLQYEEHVR